MRLPESQQSCMCAIQNHLLPNHEVAAHCVTAGLLVGCCCREKKEEKDYCRSQMDVGIQVFIPYSGFSL